MRHERSPRECSAQLHEAAPVYEHPFFPGLWFTGGAVDAIMACLGYQLDEQIPNGGQFLIICCINTRSERSMFAYADSSIQNRCVIRFDQVGP
jgi:hypothetical protein